MDPASSVWFHATNEAVTSRNAPIAAEIRFTARCHVEAPQMPDLRQFFEAEDSGGTSSLFDFNAYIREWMVREQRSQ